MTVRDISKLVEGAPIKSELLVYVLALWVFQQCEDMSGYWPDKLVPNDRAVCNHGEDNWTGDVCDVLAKLGVMEPSHMSHTFITSWRPWHPLAVNFDSTAVSDNELIAAVYYTKYQFEQRDAMKLCHRPFRLSEEVQSVPHFNLPEALSRKADEMYMLWVGRVVSTLFLKLGLASFDNVNGFKLVNSIDPLNAFVYEAFIDYDASKLAFRN
ncbi:hypothetical protein [Pseudovibrio sp. SCP19]|uniref:hypothetical protein n=1 Tax=Pseudovibrio sp. SCP19 TaxID=3141374 RepID=UPI00333C1EC9